jgi:uncharacterized protein (DUF2236 family)
MQAKVGPRELIARRRPLLTKWEPLDVGAWRAGTAYRADHPAALLWVLVTLADTSLRVYDTCFGRLPDHIVRAYLAHVARLGALLDIPPETVPPRRDAAVHGHDAGERDVAVGPAAREAVAALAHLPVLAVRRRSLTRGAALLGRSRSGAPQGWDRSP